MTQVILGENEGIESALRRFKRQVSKAGIFTDMKKLIQASFQRNHEGRTSIEQHANTDEFQKEIGLVKGHAVYELQDRCGVLEPKFGFEQGGDDVAHVLLPDDAPVD